MGLILAKCINCGANIKVDSESKKGTCEFCNAEYITEDVINNYYVTNNYSTIQYVTKNVNASGVLDAEEYIKNGDVFISLNMFDKAKSAYLKAIELNPGDWRAWFGLVKICTNNFRNYKDNTHYEYYAKAQKVATPEQLEELKNCYAPYLTKRNDLEKAERLERERKEAELKRQQQQKDAQMSAWLKEKAAREKAHKKRNNIILGIIFLLLIILGVIGISVVIKSEEKRNKANAQATELVNAGDYYEAIEILQNVGLNDKNSKLSKACNLALTGKYNALVDLGFKNLFIPEGTTKINSQTFSNYKVDSITIANSVVEIENGAFSNCTAKILWKNDPQIKILTGFSNYAGTELTIPNSVTEIGEHAFEYCTNIFELKIPESVEKINQYAFNNISAKIIWENAPINSTIKSYAFHDYRGTQISIPDGVVSIEPSAFSFCDFLTSISFGKDVNSLKYDVFYGCPDLERIEVDEKNSSLLSLDGILYDKPTTNFIHVPSKISGEITIPNGIKKLSSNFLPINNSISKIKLSDSIIDIEGKAFNNCSSLTEIFFGNGVINLPDNLFDKCTNLERITVNEVHSAFNSINGVLYNADNTKLIYTPLKFTEDIALPNTLKEIPSYAFAKRKVSAITLPNSITTIGEYAFQNCTADIIWLGTPTISQVSSYSFADYDGKEINLPKSITSISSNAFSNCSAAIIWDENNQVELISSYAFCDYNGDDIIIPKTVSYIGEYAFQNCYSNITWENDSIITQTLPFSFAKYVGATLKLPNSLTTINNDSFANCKSKTIIISNSVTTINSYAFRDCYANVDFEENSPLTQIPANSFYSYKGKNVNLPKVITSIGKYAFYNCYKLVSIELPNSITTIEEGAFMYCSSLTNLVLPENLTTIEEGTFSYCKNLTNLVLPKNLTIIRSYAFEECSCLTDLTIPESVYAIKAYAFRYCPNLTNVTFGNPNNWYQFTNTWEPILNSYLLDTTIAARYLREIHSLERKLTEE